MASSVAQSGEPRPITSPNRRSARIIGRPSKAQEHHREAAVGDKWAAVSLPEPVLSSHSTFRLITQVLCRCRAAIHPRAVGRQAVKKIFCFSTKAR